MQEIEQLAIKIDESLERVKKKLEIFETIVSKRGSSNEENAEAQMKLQELEKELESKVDDDDQIDDGIVEIISSVIQTTDASVLCRILELIGDLAREENNRNALGKTIILERISNIINTTKSFDQRKFASRALANLCFDHAENRAFFFKQGVVHPLIQFLKSGDENLQRNTAGALANLASENEQIQKEIAQLGGLNELINLLKSPSSFVQSMTARALNNIAITKENLSIMIEGEAFDVFLSFWCDENLGSELGSLLDNIYSEIDYCKPYLKKKMILHDLIKIVASRDSVDSDLMKSVMDLLILLSDQDDFRYQFFTEKVFLSILDLAYFKDSNVEHEKNIRRFALRILANLSMEDRMIVPLFEKYDLLYPFCFSEDSELVMSILMLLGNIARTDQNCKIMGENQELRKMLLEKAGDSDLRIVRASLGLIRNLSIPEQNKPLFVKEGAFPILNRIISNRENANQVIQFAAVAAIKNLIGDKYHDEFANCGGLDAIITLARGEIPIPDDPLTPEDQRPKKKDKRVQYEAARVITRILKQSKYQESIVEKGGLDPILDLTLSEYEILQEEGLIAMLTLSQQEKFKDKIRGFKELQDYKSENSKLSKLSSELQQTLK